VIRFLRAPTAENDMCVGGKFKISMTLKRSNKNWHHINKEKILSSFLLNTPIRYELVKEIVGNRVREILGEGNK
jgi:hypothetical protein